MKSYLKNDYIELGNGELLTVTQQFYVPKRFDIGYNSYWFNDNPPITHSLFIDLDNTDVTFIKELVLPNLVKIHEYLQLPETRMGLILQTSKNNHHIVIPHSYSFPQIVFILSTLSFTSGLKGLRDYLLNCVQRGYCTLRLSPKDNPITPIEPFTIIGVNNVIGQVNPHHYDLLVALAKRKHKPIYHKLKDLKDRLPMIDNCTTNILTYYSHGEITKLDLVNGNKTEVGHD